MSKHHTRLNRRKWAATRRAVFDRDGYRCQECGGAARLECHHVRPLASAPHLDPYDLDNLTTICRSCHIDGHRMPADPARRAWRQHLKQTLSNAP